MIRRTHLPALAAVLALAAAACAPADDKPSTSVSPSAAGSASAACTKDQLTLYKPGRLTIGTDKPAFEPWFKNDDPTNGEGFESAVAYAVADRLGFAKSDVAWVTVAFNSSFAPGAKKFDFDINQISVSAEREKAATFSDGYYTVNQAVVALDGTRYTDLATLRSARIAVQVGTTSLQAVQDQIKPTTQPRVFDNQIDTISALKNKQVDAVVLDLPTAFYVTAAQVKGAKIVGQLPAVGGDNEEFGLLLEKDNPLVTCLNTAIGGLKSSGELARIQDRWLTGDAGAPVLK
ncbi:MAG: ABC transporter substrate-binding protein [Streptosporangiaceae bacterium]